MSFDDNVMDLYLELLSNVDARFAKKREKLDCLKKVVELIEREDGDYFDDLARLREQAPYQRPPRGRPKGVERSRPLMP